SGRSPEQVSSRLQDQLATHCRQRQQASPRPRRASQGCSRQLRRRERSSVAAYGVDSLLESSLCFGQAWTRAHPATSGSLFESFHYRIESKSGPERCQAPRSINLCGAAHFTSLYGGRNRFSNLQFGLQNYAPRRTASVFQTV